MISVHEWKNNQIDDGFKTIRLSIIFIDDIIMKQIDMSNRKKVIFIWVELSLIYIFETLSMGLSGDDTGFESYQWNTISITDD